MPPSREPLPSWSSDRILMSGLLARSTSLQPLTRSITAETCGPFLMTTLPLPFELVDDVLAGDLAGLDVVGLTVASAPGGGDVDRDHDDAGRLRPLDRRLDRLRVGGVEQDHVDAGGDEVVDLGELLVQVVVGRDRRTLTFGLISLALASAPLRQCDEERIAERADVMPIDFRSLAEAAPAASGEGGAREQQLLQHVRSSSWPCCCGLRRWTSWPAGRRDLTGSRRPAPDDRRPIRCGRCPGAGSGRAPPRR